MSQLLELVKKMGFAQAFCLYISTLCFMYFFWISHVCIAGKEIPNSISEIKICIIGLAGSVVGYIIGSSKSSRDKDKALLNKNSDTP